MVIFCSRFGVGRPADKIALEEVASAADEKIALRASLDAFGGHLDPERTRQRDDRRDDGALFLVTGRVGDEAAVDLQLVHRKALQVGEARIARAEIVDGNRHPQRLQPLERAQRGVGLLHGRSIR